MYIAGTDFDLSRDTIPFTVGGESEQCADFIAHEDNAVESGEPVRVNLGGVVVGSPNELLITIVDTSRKLKVTSHNYFKHKIMKVGLGKVGPLSVDAIIDHTLDN